MSKDHQIGEVLNPKFFNPIDYNLLRSAGNEIFNRGCASFYDGSEINLTRLYYHIGTKSDTQKFGKPLIFFGDALLLLRIINQLFCEASLQRNKKGFFDFLLDSH